MPTAPTTIRGSFRSKTIAVVQTLKYKTTNLDIFSNVSKDYALGGRNRAWHPEPHNVKRQSN
jgi:hypothetical protein